MQGYYIVTETIKAQLEQDPFVNTVNTGIIEDVLLKKADMYPYSHLLVNNSSYQGNTWVFNLSVICMDIVDLSKDEVTEVFYGNDNQQDVLNTQLAVIARMLEVLDRGQNTKSYILDGVPNCEPFIDRFEHGVAGWTVTFDIRIPNTMTVCSTDVTPVKLCPDFTYLIKDSADNTLYTGSILSGNGLTQTITDGEVTNTLGTVLGNVLAQGSLELADVDNIDSDGSTVPTPAGVAFTCTPITPCEDATVTLNTGAFLTVASGSTTDVSLVDQDDIDIVPISVIGSTIKVNIPVASTPIGATLIKTGSTTDGGYGRAVDFFTLSSNNPFGNTNRFTKTDGTPCVYGTYEWMIDWSTFDGSTVLGYVHFFQGLGTYNVADGEAFCNSYTLQGYSGCRMANVREGFNLYYYNGQALSYSPFLIGFGVNVWTTNVLSIATSFSHYLSTGDSNIAYDANTALKYVLPVRTFTVTGTTLS